MTRETCWTSIPRANRSVVMRTRLEPERNSRIITSRSFWSMSPCYKVTSEFLGFDSLPLIQRVVTDLNTCGELNWENCHGKDNHLTQIAHRGSISFHLWPPRTLWVHWRSYGKISSSQTQKVSWRPKSLIHSWLTDLIFLKTYLLDLLGKLAGWSQHQRLTLLQSDVNLLQDCNWECCSLTSTRLCLCDHIVTWNNPNT